MGVYRRNEFLSITQQHTKNNLKRFNTSSDLNLLRACLNTMQTEDQ
jgi:hypothetical protein